VKVKACVFVLAMLCASPLLATPIVSVAVSGSAPSVGDPFSVDVSITDAADLVSYQFDLSFDPAVIALNGLAIEGPFLTAGGTLATLFFDGTDSTFDGDDTTPPGTISFVLGALFTPDKVSGAGVLATLKFDALKVGTSFLTLSGVQLFQDVSDEPVEIVDFDVRSGEVAVAAPTDTTPVPEPSTMLLLGTGVAAALKKHRARNAK